MNRLLKAIRGNRDRLLYVLGVLVVGGAVIFVADLTVYRYGLIVRAYLGASVFYLAYLCFVRLESSNGFQVKFPRDLKYMPFVFILGVTLYWAARQITNLIGYLLKAH